MSELYDASKEARSLLEVQTLLQLHLLRYSYFVDSSPRGEECVYAHHTRRYLLQELDEEIAALESRRKELGEIIDTLRDWAKRQHVSDKL